jgi:alpha-galactosidase
MNRANFKPGQPSQQKLTIKFSDVGLSGTVQVYDIWQNKAVATTETSYTTIVPAHGTAFLRLSSAK